MIPATVGVPIAIGIEFRQLLPLAASLILGLMLVALGAYAYKQVFGEGVEWPDETAEDEDSDELRAGSDEDEWDYY